MKNEELKHNLTSGSQWLRLIYMVLFAILLEVAGVVMLAIVVLQFLFSLIGGAPNTNLKRLGDQVASYIFQTLQFLIYNTEEKPFPFSEWPDSDVEDLAGYESAEEMDGEIVASAAEADADAGDVIELGADDVTVETEEKPAEAPAKKPARRKSTTAKSATTKASSSKSSSSAKSTTTKSASTKRTTKASADKTDAKEAGDPAAKSTEEGATDDK